MAQIRAIGTKPEEKVRKYLFSHGFRYRKNVKDLPGRPDIVLPKYRSVIFVNGCFWHMHRCSRFKLPSSNQDYWIPKLTRNAERDTANRKALGEQGWNVITIWECEIQKSFDETMEGTVRRLRQNHEKEDYAQLAGN